MMMLIVGVVAGLVPLATVVCALGVVFIREPERQRNAVVALSVLANRARSTDAKLAPAPQSTTGVGGAMEDVLPSGNPNSGQHGA
jgi:hypothetical protein